MSAPVSPLVRLQEDLAAKLEAESYFADISVAMVRKMQIASEVAQKLPHLTVKGGKVGVGVMIGMPTMDVEHPNLPGPVLACRAMIRVHENPVINMSGNGTQKAAEDVAMTVLRVLHGFRLEGLIALAADNPAITPNTEFEKLVTYEVSLTGKIGQSAPAKVQVPSFSAVGLQVTFTNLTSGASIIYTTNGSFPAAGNVAATVYTVPFTVNAGTVVRWAAYKSGAFGSDVGQWIAS